MQLERTFSVTAPVEMVWDTLMDFERVAGCIPGAQILEKTSEDEYQVGLKVKLGPVTMQYKGTLHVIERDAEARQATLQGKARETRGQGAAEATVTMQLAESGTATEGTVNADLTLSGKAAAMGKSVIGSVTDQMLAVFTRNLQEMISSPDGRTPAAEADPAPVPPAPSPTQTPARSAEGTKPAAPPSYSAPAPAAAPATVPAGEGGDSLDGLALVRQIIAGQLRSPGKVLGLVLAVAALAHLSGRRSGRRRALAVLQSGGA